MAGLGMMVKGVTMRYIHVFNCIVKCFLFICREYEVRDSGPDGPGSQLV